MERSSEKPHNHRFLAQVEADLVLVNRDLSQIEIKLRSLSDAFYRSLGKQESEQINREYQFYQQEKQNLLQEKKLLDDELVTFGTDQSRIVN